MEQVHFPAEAAEVFDVSGAGDTVLATLAAGMAAGLALPIAARLANIAAGVVVGKVGTAVARVLDEPGFRTRAGALRDAFAACDAMASILTALDDLARSDAEAGVARALARSA